MLIFNSVSHRVLYFAFPGLAVSLFDDSRKQAISGILQGSVPTYLRRGFRILQLRPQICGLTFLAHPVGLVTKTLVIRHAYTP